MKIALLGYGKEGQAAEKYFVARGAEITKFENFTDEEILREDLSGYDLILRSPSVRPHEGWSSVTKYFFEHCPCPIIGVTATKGKGTTCSFIASLLRAMGEKVFLVGNIGVPAISVLDELTADSVVVYEMSSFQLWDLDKSPQVAVVGMIEPDHLNVHTDFDEYVMAKANIGRYQSETDYLVYYRENADSLKIANESKAQKVAYPGVVPAEILNAVMIPGQHNRNNAEAAVAAVACYYGKSMDEFIAENGEKIKAGLGDFKGLPHRLEFLREIDGVLYYDDNFATNAGSTRVAVEAFGDKNIILILGGRDKTDYEDLPEVYEILTANQNIRKVILMGESGHEIAKRYNDERFIVVESLAEAVGTARSEAEKLADVVVLMSPAAASFDMFENVYDRGAQFQKMISEI